MEEIVISLHMHTPYSDGSGSHAVIANAAVKAGLDAVIVTDHNVIVKGFERYWDIAGKKLLMLVGEEIHDQARDPQKNHLLVFNTNEELAQHAPNPQNLINVIKSKGGLSFIAHLYDPDCPPINETDISWEDWSVQGFTGIELWNSLSDLKIRSKTFLQVLFFIFFPRWLNIEPPVQHLKKWNELLAHGRKIVAVGGADAHDIKVQRGPLHRSVYPYEFHFRGITTHILLSQPMIGDVEQDKTQIFSAMEKGHCFVANDLFSSAKGFAFKCEGANASYSMGDEFKVEGGLTFKISLPKPTECQLLKDGAVVKEWTNRQQCVYSTTEPGVYRVEVFHKINGRRLGWIFSNPIYAR